MKKKFFLFFLSLFSWTSETKTISCRETPQWGSLLVPYCVLYFLCATLLCQREIVPPEKPETVTAQKKLFYTTRKKARTIFYYTKDFLYISGCAFMCLGYLTVMPIHIFYITGQDLYDFLFNSYWGICRNKNLRGTLVNTKDKNKEDSFKMIIEEVLEKKVTVEYDEYYYEEAARSSNVKNFQSKLKEGDKIIGIKNIGENYRNPLSIPLNKRIFLIQDISNVSANRRIFCIQNKSKKIVACGFVNSFNEVQLCRTGNKDDIKNTFLEENQLKDIIKQIYAIESEKKKRGEFSTLIL